MQIIGVGHAGCRHFTSFEELADSPLLREFTEIVVGNDIDVLPVDTDFQAYARSRERERLGLLDDQDRVTELSRKLGSIH
jgi:hypothetical protein